MDGLIVKFRIGFILGVNTEQNVQILLGKFFNDMIFVGKSELNQLVGSELRIILVLFNVKSILEFLFFFDFEGIDESRDIWLIGMVIIKKDNVVIVDRDNKKIKVFDSVGKLLKEFIG